MAEKIPEAESARAVRENVQGLIGSPIDRIDGPAKVSGRATYSYEYKEAGQALYGFIVEATAAKAGIENIDASAAEAAPGVVMVLTHRNAPRLAPPHPRTSENRFDRSEPFLQSGDVRYFGEPVALVLAESYEAARHGAGLVAVRYRKLPDARFDLKANQADSYTPKKVNAGYESDTQQGDFEAAFAEAEFKVDATYVMPHRHNNPMEPHATIAEWTGDSVLLYSGQHISRVRAEHASQDIPDTQREGAHIHALHRRRVWRQGTGARAGDPRRFGSQGDRQAGEGRTYPATDVCQHQP